VVPGCVFLSAVGALELWLRRTVFCIVFSRTVPAGFCLATDWCNVAVGLAFEALRESRLWAIVFREVYGEVADETASDDPIGHLLRRNTDYQRAMCFARGVPAVEPGEPRDLETIMEGLVFLLQLSDVLCSSRVDRVYSNAVD
jgi:hypothetical protein